MRTNSIHFPWMITYFFIFMISQLPVCHGQTDYPPVTDLQNLIDITEHSVFITGYANGTLNVYTYQFALLQSRLICLGTLTRIEKLPYGPCYIVQCGRSLEFHCYTGTVVIKQVYTFQFSIRGYLIWPYFDLYIYNATGFSQQRQHRLCQVLIDKFTFICEKSEQIQRTKFILTQSNSYKSVKIEVTSTESLVTVYSEALCPIKYTLPFLISNFITDRIGSEMFFWENQTLYRCTTDSCQSDYSLFWNLGFEASSSKSLCIKNQKLIILGAVNKIFSLQLVAGFASSSTEVYRGKPILTLFEISSGFIGYQSNKILVKILMDDKEQSYLRITPLGCRIDSSNNSLIDLSNITTQSLGTENQTAEQTTEQLTEQSTEQASQPALESTSELLMDETISSTDIEDDETRENLVNFFSAVISFPYSGMALKLILPQFLQQMWYYEYHDYAFNNQTLNSLKFIGSVNRNKFLPIFVKKVLGESYTDYDEKRKSFAEPKKEFSDDKFLKNQKEPVMFMANTAKLYIQNVIYSLLLYIILRLIAHATKRWPYFHSSFSKFLINHTILLFLFQSHIQFVTFMFIQQVKMIGSQNFSQKGNIILMLLFTFGLLMFVFGSYPILKYFMQPSKFQIAVPQIKKLNYQTYLVLVLIGGGRRMILGVIQSLYYSLPLQMILLSISHFMSVIIYGKLMKLSKTISISLPELYLKIKSIKFMCLTVFTLSVLNGHLELIGSKAAMDQIQILCICFISMACVGHILYDIISIITRFIEHIRTYCRNDENMSGVHQEQDQMLREISLMITKRANNSDEYGLTTGDQINFHQIPKFQLQTRKRQISLRISEAEEQEQKNSKLRIIK